MLAGRDEISGPDSEKGRVTLATIHASKGLEWPNVIGAGYERYVIPSDRASTKEELEEERRMGYVLTSRAVRVLALSYALRRDGRHTGPSRFIAESLGARSQDSAEQSPPAEATASVRPPRKRRTTGPLNETATQPPLRRVPGGREASDQVTSERKPDMAELLLPAGSYEEALPDLRAPYLPSQIRPLIIAVPKNEKAPCKIALYTIGETLMDRFNLVCGTNWERPKFTIEIHDKREELIDDDKKRVLHYLKIRCVLTVFGQEHEDSGEGESENIALAEYDARAQAFKRAARWHGPGQCLYVFGGEEVIMWRGAGAGKLQIPKSGTEPHRHPYFDKQGRAAIRAEYGRWLKDDGEALFGAPLDHQKIAQDIKARMSARLTAIPAPRTPQLTIVEQPPSSAPATQETEGDAHGPEQPPAGEPAERVSGAMPELPASAATIRAAEDSGYDEQVAKALSSLAAAQDQSRPLTDAQERVVHNWLVALARFEVPVATILDAVAFVAKAWTARKHAKRSSRSGSPPRHKRTVAPHPPPRAPPPPKRPHPRAPGKPQRRPR